MWKPQVLVLGPGGIKGFLELGALCVLESNDLLSEVHTYVGVSVGAILSLLIVCGYSMTEIIIEAADADIFEDISKFDFQDIHSNVGIVSSSPIKRKLIRKVLQRFGYVPTLQQLYNETGLTLVTVTANLNQEKTEYMSHLTEPELSCVDAVMFSMNIPLIFYKLKYKGCIYVDGALGNPYPIDPWDDGETNILGIYTKSTQKTDKEPEGASTTMYIHKIIHFSMTQIRDRIIENSSKRCKHIELTSNIIDSTGFTINAQMKADMVLKGVAVAEAFLKEIQSTNVDLDPKDIRTSLDRDLSCDSSSQTSKTLDAVD
jgi:predicted acylesterase/phospholipase RssA